MANTNNKQIPVPESMYNLIKALQDLIEDGYKRIETITLEGKDRSKKLVAAATFAAAQDRAEAIALLAEKLKPDPALVVLRSMHEGYLNLCYILQTENDARLFAMFYGGAKSDLEKLDKLKQTMDKLPSIDGKILSLDQAKQAIHDLEKMRDEALNKLKGLNDPEFRKPHYPDLLTRAQRYDETSAKSGQHSHLVLDYRMQYFYLSQFTHLGTSALNDLIKESPTEIQINDNDPIPKCELVLLTAFTLLADTLILTLKRFDQSTDNLFKELTAKTRSILPPLREGTSGIFGSGKSTIH